MKISTMDKATKGKVMGLSQRSLTAWGLWTHLRICEKQWSFLKQANA